MNRMTDRNGEGVAFLHSWASPNDAIERLAAYEDGGLEPEEIDYRNVNAIFAENDRIKSLAEEGRLLELPCRFGETVWQVIKTDRRHGSRASGGFVYHVTWHLLTWNNVRHVIKDFGKTVFLTRAEAEAAMELMKEAEKA